MVNHFTRVAKFFATLIATVAMLLAAVAVSPASAAPSPTAPSTSSPLITKSGRFSGGGKTLAGSAPIRKPIKAGQVRAFAGPYYWYAGGRQTSASNNITQMGAALSVGNPWVDVTGGDHSLAELAMLRDVSGVRQIVEVGWCANCLGDGDMRTRLFVAYWVNDVFGGYNTNFTIACSSSPCDAPGAIYVPYDSGGHWTGNDSTERIMEIRYVTAAGSLPNRWEIWVSGKRIGYFNASLWSSATGGAFTGGNRADFFGEVASDINSPTCADMGKNGLTNATSTSGAYFGGSAINSATAVLSLFQTNSTLYNVVMQAPGSPTVTNTIFYGGDSSC